MPPADTMDPAVKRSGWQPPQNTGLWAVSDRVQHEVWDALSPEQSARLKVCNNTTPMLSSRGSFCPEMSQILCFL